MAKYLVSGKNKDGKELLNVEVDITDEQLAQRKAKHPGLKFEPVESPTQKAGKAAAEVATEIPSAMASALAEKADTAVRQQIGDTIRDPKSTALGAGMLGILNGVSLGLADDVYGWYSPEGGKQLESAMQAAETEHPYIYNAADIATGLIPGAAAAVGGAKLANKLYKGSKFLGKAGANIIGAATGAAGAGAVQGSGNQPQGQKDFASLDVAIPAGISALTEGIGRKIPWGKIGTNVSNALQSAKKASTDILDKIPGQTAGIPKKVATDIKEVVESDLPETLKDTFEKLKTKKTIPSVGTKTPGQEWAEAAKEFNEKVAAELDNSTSAIKKLKADAAEKILTGEKEAAEAAAGLGSLKGAATISAAKKVGEVVREEYAKLPIVDQLYASVKEIESEIAAIGVPQSAEERARLKELTDELNTYKQDLIPYRVAPESQLKKRTDAAEEARKKSKEAAEERRTAAKKIWLDKAGVKK